MKSKLHTSLFCGILLMVFVFMMVLNRLTPYAIDDLHMLNHFITGEELTGVGDVVESQCQDYLDHTGRVVSHFLWQLSCYLLIDSKWVFDIMNSAVLVGMVLLMYVHVRGTLKEPDAVLLLFMVVSLFIFVEGFGQDFLWVAGSFNYLWMTALVLLFLLPYRVGNGNAYMMFPLGVVAGCSMENLSISGSILLCAYLYYIYRERRELQTWAVAGAVGFWIGSLILICAPGNYVRMNEVGEGFSVVGVVGNAIMLTKIFMNKDCLGVLCMMCGMLYVCRIYMKKQTETALYGYIILTVFSIYSLAGVSYFPERVRMSSVVFATIVCGMLMPKARELSVRNAAIPLAVMLAVLFSSFRDALRSCEEVRDFYAYVDREIDKAKTEGRDSVEIEGYVGDSRFCLFGKTALFSTDARAWVNADYARHRGIKTLRVSEERVRQYSD